MTPRQFKALQAKWYRKLEKSGFKDLENDKGQLRDDTSVRRLKKRMPEDVDARREYYTRAEHYLLEKEAPWVPLDRAIWAAHADGLSYAAIAKRLDVALYVVRRAIERLRREAGLTPGALAKEPTERIEVGEDPDAESFGD